MLKAIRSFIKSHKFLHSLKFQLLTVLLVLGAAVLFVMRGLMMSNIYERNLEAKTNELLSKVQSVANHMEAYDFMGDQTSESIRSELSLLVVLAEGRVMVTDSQYRIIYDSYSKNVGGFIDSEQVLRAMGGNEAASVDETGGYINVSVPIYYRQVDTVHPKGTVYVQASLQNLNNEMKKMKSRSLLIVFVTWIIYGGLSYVVAVLFSMPLNHLSKAIESVASFEDSDILPEGYYETEGIAKSFNAQRSRLKSLDDSRQEFVSNVSHELKTPLAAMKVLADSLITQGDAPIEMYRDFMTDIADEIDRENKIITDLLTLVHMDQGKEGLNLERVEVNGMIELINKRLTPIANESDVEIVFETTAENIYADIDEVKMTLAITNLIENAIKYNHREGTVRVFTNVEHQFLVIEVSDNGIGIPKESLPHIYERFYRVDKSHSKEIGGTGLGLPITRKIILLHRGSIKCESEKNKGTVFTVRIPANRGNQA